MSKTRKTRRRQPATASTSASRSAGGNDAVEQGSDADNNKADTKDSQAEDASDDENVTCPSCEDNPKRRPLNSKDKVWVECEACEVWYHWTCVGRGPLEMVDKW